MKSTVLLTGATGFVGSNLLKALILKNYEVICIVRSRNGKSPETRLKNTLAATSPNLNVPEKYNSHVKIYHGDITQNYLGLSLQDYKYLTQNITSVFHCAAAISFSDTKVEQIRETNITGTENVLSFINDSTVAEGLHYIGTAYIAGDREDIVYEDDLDKGQKFNNVYEETKLAAEKKVEKFRRDTKRKVTIYRPGIIVGDSNTGVTIRFNTMYQFLKVLHVLKSSFSTNGDGKTHMPIRIIGNPKATKNFVPIDYVVNMVMKIFLQPKSHGKNYHIVNNNSPTVDLIKEVILDVLNITGPEFISPHSFRNSPPSEIEQIFIDETAVYSPYLLKEPVFDNTNLLKNDRYSENRCPPMGREALTRLFEFAVHSDWGRKIWKKVRRSNHVPKGKSKLIEKYFTQFLPSVMGRSIFADLDNLNVCIGFYFTDSQKQWMITLKQGILKEIKPNLPENSEVNYELDDETFSQIISGELSPQEAFFTNKSKIKGDTLKGLKLATIFDRFIKQYPFEIS